jgi:hypothetical protein
MNKDQTRAALGIKVRADGLCHPWTMNDAQYMSASANEVRAALMNEATRNAWIAHEADAALTADYERLRDPKVYTLAEFRLSRIHG